MAEPKIEIYPSIDELSRAAADLTVTLARAAIKDRGQFVLALAGGDTPRPYHQWLTQADDIDWNKVFVFWGDERAVPPDDPQSNYGMARDTLLRHVPIPAVNIYRMEGELEPQEAAVNYQQILRHFFTNELPRFDLIMLGLGSNAHTASLFPHTPALHITDEWVSAPYIEEIQASRLTLTAPVLNNARHVVFLVTGEAKAPALLQVVRGEHDPDKYPAQIVRPTDGTLLWMVDVLAAELL